MYEALCPVTRPWVWFIVEARTKPIAASGVKRSKLHIYAVLSLFSFPISIPHMKKGSLHQIVKTGLHVGQ